ncbi:MAG: hypothetical protein QXY10_03380, partial [Candidatus Micrarchaeaceae archaeon]
MVRNKMQKDLIQIKEALKKLSYASKKNDEVIKVKAKAEETNSNLFLLLKFIMDENKKSTMLIKNISDAIERLTNEIEGPEETKYEEPTAVVQKEVKHQEIALSALDAKIIEHIQVKGMCCADDIKEIMNYKGRNAASSRLNSLYKRNLLQRYQLGHKVYYKFNA